MFYLYYMVIIIILISFVGQENKPLTTINVFVLCKRDCKYKKYDSLVSNHTDIYTGIKTIENSQKAGLELFHFQYTVY